MAVNGLLEHAVDWGYTTRISVHTPCGVLVLVQSCMQLLSRPNNLALLGKPGSVLELSLIFGSCGICMQHWFTQGMKHTLAHSHPLAVHGPSH